MQSRRINRREEREDRETQTSPRVVIALEDSDDRSSVDEGKEEDSDEAPASVHGDEETRHVQSRRTNRREEREDSDADLSSDSTRRYCS